MYRSLTQLSCVSGPSLTHGTFPLTRSLTRSLSRCGFCCARFNDTALLASRSLAQINQMLPIGGPGGALTAYDQAQMLFRITGQKENLLSVPVAIMDAVIGVLDFFAKFLPAQFEVGRLCCAGGMPFVCVRAIVAA